MGVTNIKTITNRLIIPVTVRNGENTQQLFTVAQGDGWNGDLWVPWVFGGYTMWKSIQLDMGRKLYIFQNGNAIYYVWDSNDSKQFDHRAKLGGNNRVNGEVGVVIDTPGSVYLD
jgi:hypothetical protein